ncbi:MAG: hypothetical protein ACT4OI_01225 [Methanobacteriota archaeon]
MLACGLLLVPVASSAQADLVTERVRFSLYVADVIPAVAVDAACEVIASGESIELLGGAVDGTSVAVAPGPCSISVILFGTEVPLPLVNTTPLGVRSFYLPGLAIVTLGLVDVSVDLVSSLNATSEVADPDAATVEPEDHTWTAWGARRVVVRASDGFGGRIATRIETEFTWSVSLALTVWALSVPLYQVGLTSLGAVRGAPALATPLVVDLRPPPLEVRGPEDLTHGGATVRWDGTLAEDVDHLELWADDGTARVAYHVAPTATQVRVPLRPDTGYEVWLDVVDEAGQRGTSERVAFESPAAPSEVAAQALDPVSLEALLAVGIAAAVGYAIGARRRRVRE